VSPVGANLSRAILRCEVRVRRPIAQHRASSTGFVRPQRKSRKFRALYVSNKAVSITSFAHSGTSVMVRCNDNADYAQVEITLCIYESEF
jgi:hypothetical protein